MMVKIILHQVLKNLCCFGIFLIFSGLVFLPSSHAADVVTDIFNVYTDAGLIRPPLNGLPAGAVIWAWSGPTLQEAQDPQSPERLKHMQTTTTRDAGWGVFFNNNTANYTVDLSRFTQGALKFSVKTDVALYVQIKTIGGAAYQCALSSYGVTNTGTWQDVVIPLKDFSPSATFTDIHSPFIVNAAGAGHFSIDNIRWETDLTGYTPTPVKVVGRKLLVNNVPFTVRGVAGEMTPAGEDGVVYDWSLFPVNYTRDIPLMKAMGVNTIRTYKKEPTQKAALDALYAQGIYVVMGFPVDPSYRDALGATKVVNFGDPVVRANIKTRFVAMVHHWKNHPAILMWMLGNEVNAALDNTNRAAWYSLVNECAAAAHAEEGAAYHPVTSANADSLVNPWAKDMLTYNSLMPDLDLWSLQMYRGAGFSGAFAAFKTATAKLPKPLLVSEFGADAYDARAGYGKEDQAVQKKYLLLQWADIAANLSAASPAGVCIGGIVFSWRDGWWKRESGNDAVHDVYPDWQNINYVDNNMNEEWWGLVAISSDPNTRSPREAYHYIWPFSISGTVQSNGVSTVGVKIQAVSSNNMGNFTVDVPVGKYVFNTIPSGWEGSLTPVKSGFYFTPAARVYAGSGGVIENKQAQDFVMEPIIYNVSGMVTDAVSGKGIKGVEIKGGTSTLAITGLDGSFTFSKYPGWTGTIGAVSAIYTLTPASLKIPMLTGSVTGKNFTGMMKTYSIFGS
ncbi:MAG: glycoside hydrolase family 2 TIM barrel-domain containing protein, partial [Candidatus Omnitrophota bacterium]